MTSPAHERKRPDPVLPAAGPAPSGGPATAAAPDRLGRAALLALCACVLVAQSMVAAINLLIPQLAASSLHPSSEQLLWAVDAYVIAFACLLVPAGAVGDRFGRKGILLTGLGLFGAGAATSALATGPVLLIAGRALCGCGAALAIPATMAAIVHLAAPARRPQALAAWTLAMGLGGLAGNLGGGAVGQFLSWRALFWAMVPLAALLALAVALAVPRTARHDAAVDPLGSALLTGALVALVHGLIAGPGHGWSAPRVLGSFVAGALLLALFLTHALRAERPLFDPRIFRNPRLRAGALGVAVSFFALFALFYVNAQYLQYAKGYGVLRTGLAIVPVTVGMALLPRIGVRWAARSGPRPLVALGLALIGAGLLLVSTAGAGTPYPLYACYLLVLSAGMGLCGPSLTTTLVSELPAHQAGLGSGLNTAAREIGAALGVAVVGTALARHSAGAHPAAGVDAFTHAMGTGLRIVAVLALAATVLVVHGFRGRRG
ncbi:MFS transporter [Streptomyces sp. NPDC007088]|uniref:MFS transporter n=1 Tax=Streptomyces sp. NPDC007088 TaxID=3364773 RepID=UPI0036831A4F